MTNKNRILVVEHRKEILKRITDVLVERHFIVYSTDEKDKAITICLENNIDVVLVDSDIMQGTGLNLVFEFKKNEDLKLIPVMLISTLYKNVEFIERAYSLDVDGMVFIPIDELDLVSKINSAFKIKESNINLNRLQNKIREIAVDLESVTLLGDMNLAHFLNQKKAFDSLVITDGVTGLLNQKEFMVRLDNFVDEAIYYEDSIVYAIFEIDYFDNLKETFENTVIENIFLRTAEIITLNTHKKDILSKFDDDSFVVVYKRTTEDKVEAIASDIKSKIDAVEIVVDDVVVKFSISVGLVCTRYKHTYRFDNLEKELSQAYIALMNAKRRGVSSVFVHPSVVKK